MLRNIQDLISLISTTAPLDEAALKNIEQFIEANKHTAAIFNQRVGEDYFALTVAATFGHVRVVEMLLQVKGLDVNVTTRIGFTALIIATRYCYKPIKNDPDNDDKTNYKLIVKLLLGHDKTNVNIQDAQPLAALQWACAFNLSDVTEELLKNEDIDVDAQGKGGRSALMFACAAKSVVIINKLLAKGAKVNLKDEDGKTAYDFAVANHINDNTILEKLNPTTRNNAKSSIKSNDEFLKELRGGYIRFEPSIDDIINYIKINKNDAATFTAVDGEGNNALMLAAKGMGDGATFIRAMIDNVSKEILEVASAAINTKGRTAMKIAIYSQNKEAVQELLKLNPNITDDLFFAAVRNNANSIDVLMQAMITNGDCTPIMKVLLRGEYFDLGSTQAQRSMCVLGMDELIAELQRDSSHASAALFAKLSGMDYSLRLKTGLQLFLSNRWVSYTIKRLFTNQSKITEYDVKSDQVLVNLLKSFQADMQIELSSMQNRNLTEQDKQLIDDYLNSGHAAKLNDEIVANVLWRWIDKRPVRALYDAQLVTYIATHKEQLKDIFVPKIKALPKDEQNGKLDQIFNAKDEKCATTLAEVCLAGHTKMWRGRTQELYELHLARSDRSVVGDFFGGNAKPLTSAITKTFSSLFKPAEKNDEQKVPVKIRSFGADQ